MSSALNTQIDELLSRAAEACSLQRGRALGESLHELCRRAGEEAESPDRDQAAHVIAGLSDAELEEALRFITARFHLLNKAEQVRIIRVNQDRASAATRERPRPESVAEAMLQLERAGLDGAAVRGLVARLDVQPTLTAHPTEAKRRSVLDNLVRIAALLQAPAATGRAEREAVESRLEGLVQVLLATDDVRPKRLEVIDEVKNGLFFLRSSIWSAVPRLMRELAYAANDVFGPGTLDLTELPALLRYRTWIGGDRDGNPRVTHEVTAATLAMFRSAAIELWDRELLELQQELTISARRVPIPAWFVELVAAEGYGLIDDPASLEQRQFEPVRVRLMQLRGRVKRDPAYDGASLLRDLLAVRDAVRQAGLSEVAGSGRLAEAIVRARVFGLHLATLDIRQHSRVHEAVVAELLALADVTPDYRTLSEEERVRLLRAELAQPRPLRPVGARLSEQAEEHMRTLEAVRRAVAIDRRSVRSYIISMTHGVSDVLEVLLLMKEAGLAGVRRDAGHAGPPALAGTLHVVPLLETIEDLRRAEGFVGAMLDEPLYRAHVQSLIPPELPADLPTRAPVQEIMLGYSDSNKDGGFFMANLALDRAQRSIAEAVRSRGLLLRFFHGRGGTIGRGGGRAGRAILATPAPARTGRIRFTEQGEVISFRYALPAIAERHLEQILHASVVASGLPGEPDAPAEVGALFDRLAERSMRRYRELIDDPDFWPWFVATGPIASIAGLPIASRPIMRDGAASAAAAGSGDGSGFEQLRAIPWVFTWVQMRCLAPGWYGLGSAIGDASEAEIELLARQYRVNPWFSTVIDNAAQELARVRMPIVRRYALSSPSPASRRLYDLIEAEFAASVRGVLRISGRSRLGEEFPIIAESIRQRGPWTDVLNLIQIELLRRRARLTAEAGVGAAGRSPGSALDVMLMQSVSAIAAAMQSTG